MNIYSRIPKSDSDWISDQYLDFSFEVLRSRKIFSMVSHRELFILVVLLSEVLQGQIPRGLTSPYRCSQGRPGCPGREI